MELCAKRVLLTGATGGLGQATARALKSEGAELILTGRRSDILESLCAELGAQAIVCDLGQPAEIPRVLERAGRVDILIANAGLPSSARYTDCTPDEIARVLQVNLQAPMLLALALMPQMQARGEGHMVFTSSMAGKVAAPLAALYSTSKFGLRGFAQCLRIDLHASGVGVSCVFPGIIRNAGMFVNTGAKPPPGIGTNTPEDVARGVIRAIRHNLGEVDVAPRLVRFWGWFSSAAPGWSAAIQHRFDAAAVVEEFTSGTNLNRQ